MIPEMPDYDKALYYTIWGQWDNLFLLMSRTDDDLLAKKLNVFFTITTIHPVKKTLNNLMIHCFTI